jgi:hypothetical protein
LVALTTVTMSRFPPQSVRGFVTQFQVEQKLAVAAAVAVAAAAAAAVAAPLLPTLGRIQTPTRLGRKGATQKGGVRRRNGGIRA